MPKEAAVSANSVTKENDRPGMKADLAECKKHCQDQAYGAFVVQGDGRAYFKRQKAAEKTSINGPQLILNCYII